MANFEDNLQELWETTMAQIKDSLPKGEYDTWFTRLRLGSVSNGKLTLYVVSSFVKDKFESTYKALIENTFSELGGKPYNVFFEIKKTQDKEVVQPVRTVQKEVKKSSSDCILNPAYSFESFVPGDNSRFAYNACMAIAKNPGSTYNPCLIYGGVGLGKTHLLQSIGNYLTKENPKLKVVYVTAENFTNEFIQSVNDKNPQQFKNKYRKVAVLLVDDIHFLQKKEGTQNELFNTFNDLYDSGRQIVFTCDRPVEELKDISERLRSRFQRGLNIDLLPPDYETRIAILHKKCQEHNFSLSNDVIEYIATNISNNVRSLEACLTKLIAYCNLLQSDMSLATAKDLLKQEITTSNDTTGITIDLIIRTVAGYFNVSPFDIKGKNRSQSLVLPRQIAMYLCRKLTDYSTTEIALEFGGKAHTTVMYNTMKVESMLKSSEKELMTTITKLTHQIKSESKK